MHDQRVDLPEAAQYGRDEQTCEGAIPRRQERHIGIILDGVVERALPSQDGADQVDGHTAGRWNNRHGGSRY